MLPASGWLQLTVIKSNTFELKSTIRVSCCFFKIRPAWWNTLKYKHKVVEHNEFNLVTEAQVLGLKHQSDIKSDRI